MMYLVAYDLREPDYPKALAALKKETKKCAGGKKNWCNIGVGPILMDSRKSAKKILAEARNGIRQQAPDHDVLNDRVLVVPLGDRPICADRGHGLEAKFGKRIRTKDDGLEMGRILAISYTLRGSSRKRREKVRRAIWKGFPDCTYPTRTLFFVRSNKSAHEVFDEIKKVLPDAAYKAGTGKKDTLLVVQVGDEVARTGLDWIHREPFWLWDHSVDSKHGWRWAA